MLRVVTFCGRPFRVLGAAARQRGSRENHQSAAGQGSNSRPSAQALMRRGVVQQSGGAAVADQRESGYVVCRVLSCLRGARATSVDAGLQTGCSVQQQQSQAGKGIAIQSSRVRAVGEAWWTGSRC